MTEVNQIPYEVVSDLKGAIEAFVDCLQLPEVSQGPGGTCPLRMSCRGTGGHTGPQKGGAARRLSSEGDDIIRRSGKALNLEPHRPDLSGPELSKTADT